jgi:hypothetical protein
VTDGKAPKDPAAKDPTLVERWIEDQREWQRTAMAYLDSMVKNDDFLVHLGNAMRGSLLAGKPYPSAAAAPPAQEALPVDNRVDQVLFALHQMQGQLNDLQMAVDELRMHTKPAPSTSTPAADKTPKTARAKRRAAGAARKTRPGKARG